MANEKPMQAEMTPHAAGGFRVYIPPTPAGGLITFPYNLGGWYWMQTMDPVPPPGPPPPPPPPVFKIPEGEVK